MVNKIVVIIVTYNPMSWINKLYNYLLEEALLETTIFIDNCSTDGFNVWVKNNDISHQVIFQSENLGFGAANNIGLEIAIKRNAKFILLLNQDAWLEPGALNKLVLLMNENNNLGMVSPLHLNRNLNYFDKNFKDYLTASDLTDFVLKSSKNPNSQYVNTCFVNAAIWLLSSECIEKVGGFNPSFYHYGEDNEYCNRLIDKGFEIAILPSAIGVHDREHRDNKFLKSKEHLKCLNASKIYFFKSKHERAFYRTIGRLVINKDRFQLGIFLRLKISFRLILDKKTLEENKYISQNQRTPFLHFE